MNIDGEIIAEPVYDVIYSPVDGYSIVKKGSKYGFFNHDDCEYLWAKENFNKLRFVI